MCVQAKASGDLFPLAQDNNLAGVKECIMNGANVDEYKDWVREKKTLNQGEAHTRLTREGSKVFRSARVSSECL